MVHITVDDTGDKNETAEERQGKGKPGMKLMVMGMRSGKDAERCENNQAGKGGDENVAPVGNQIHPEQGCNAGDAEA